MTCKTCGASDGKFYRPNWCSPCYYDYLRDYRNRRYAERMLWAVMLLGGKCVDCGSKTDLEFDHIDPATKSFNVTTKLAVWSKVRLEVEIKKCALRCRACHRARTVKQQSVEHGQGLTGRRNCRCELCGPLKRAYKNARSLKIRQLNEPV